ncbi:MAG: hypothetical protein HY543_02370 [Deltaproteobacteria bacterium]|nr:hypothetical protein [Deltaproteobacteria bacterium]
MRALWFPAAVILAGASAAAPAMADGCYLCEEGGYVRFEGSDTFDKRKEAKQQFGCTVTGTASSCTTSHGTVAWFEKYLPPSRG